MDVPSPSNLGKPGHLPAADAPTASQLPDVELAEVEWADVELADEMPVLELVPEPPVQNSPAAMGQPGMPPGVGPMAPSAAVPGQYIAPPGYPPANGYPAGMPAPPPGYPLGQPLWDKWRGWYYPTPEELARAQSAHRQVVLSRWLGWGGLAVLFVGPLVAVMLTRGRMPELYGSLAGVGLMMAIVGAIVGQIGRAKQNRVI